MRINGVLFELPVIDSVITIYNIIHETNWWEKGRNIDELGLAGMSLEQIKHYVRIGKQKA